MTSTSHKNQFDKIRILAALAVICSHHFPLYNFPAPIWIENVWLHWSMMGGVAVMVFLSISGYLVTTSWLRKPRFVPFIWNRFLRVWPGMMGSVLVCIFFFGLLFTALPAYEFLTSRITGKFVLYNALLYPSSAVLPDVFMLNKFAQSVNGVYWTIPLEFMCYLVLGFLGLLGALRHRWLANVVGLVYIVGFLVFFNSDFVTLRHWVEYPAYFVAGALIAVNDDWFKRHGGKFLLVLVPILLYLYFYMPYRSTVRFFLLPSLIIYVGNLPARESWFTRAGDPSYGIYLYGYPIAQTVIALWPDLNFWWSLGLACVLSIGAGYASWFFLESRVLKLKSLFANGGFSANALRRASALR